MNNDSFRIQDILSQQQQQQQQLFPTNSNVFLLVFSQTSCFFTHEGIWLLEIPETDSEGPTWQSGLARPQSGKFVWAEANHPFSTCWCFTMYFLFLSVDQYSCPLCWSTLVISLSIGYFWFFCNLFILIICLKCRICKFKVLEVKRRYCNKILKILFFFLFWPF